jgi:hypothetical protein
MVKMASLTTKFEFRSKFFAYCTQADLIDDNEITFAND